MQGQDEMEIVVGAGTNELKVLVEARGKMSNVQKVVSQTYDRKMKQIRQLPTKEAVLEKCHDLLLTKTLEYMNLSGQTESNHIKALQRLNDVIDKKDFALFEREKEMRQLKNQIATRDERIVELHGQIEYHKRKFQKNNEENTQNMQKLLEKHDKELLALKNKQQEAIDKSEHEKRSLLKKIDAAQRKAQQIQLEMSLLGQNKEKEISDLIDSKVLEIETKHEKVVTTLERQVKTLESLLKTTNAEFGDIRKKNQHLEETLLDIHNRKGKLIAMNTLTIVVKPTPPLLPPPPQPPPLQSPTKLKIKIQSTKTTPRTESKKVTRETQCSSPGKKPTPRAPPELPPEPPLIQIKPSICTLDFGTEINDGDLQPVHPTIDDLEKLKAQNAEIEESLTTAFNREKAELIKHYSLQIKDLQKQYLEEYQLTLVTVERNTKAMEALHQERLAVEDDRYTELEKLYLTRPSRQEDIDYIKTLTDQNLELAGLCAQTNDKLKLSYQALRKCQHDFESFRRNQPMDLKGVSDQSIEHPNYRNNSQKSQQSLSPTTLSANKIKRMTEPSLGPGRACGTMKLLYRPVRRNHDYKRTEQQIIEDMMRSIVMQEQRPAARRRVHTSVQGNRRRVS